MREKEPWHLKGKHALVLWAGWVLGPGAWAIHESASYVLVPVACETGVTWPMHAVTALSIASAAAGIGVSYYLLRRIQPRRPDGDDRVLQRSRMQALIGIGLSVIAVSGISLEAFGTLLIDYCAGV